MPLEMLETVLMRAFLMLYVLDKSRIAERKAFTTLASVCWNWSLTLTGWPDSPTGHWVRHQLRKLTEREYFVF